MQSLHPSERERFVLTARPFIAQKHLLAIRFPIFRKYFQKHGKQQVRTWCRISTKGLPNYDLSIRVGRGIGIAYVKGAHP
jgi:hypothetical protein